MKFLSVLVLSLFAFPILCGALAAGSGDTLFSPGCLDLEKQVWQVPIGEFSGGKMIVGAIADGNDLFILDSGDTLHCIDLKKGVHKWILKLPGTPTFKPVLSGESVAMVIKDRVIVVKRSTGSRITDRKIKDAPCTGIVHLDRSVYAGALYKERFISVDTSTGITGWAYRFADIVSATPVLYGQGSNLFLYAASHDGSIVCLPSRAAAEAKPEKPVWKHVTGGRLVADPVADRDTLFVPSTDGSLYAFNRMSGAIKWKFFASGALVESPKLIGNLIFQKVGDKIHCLDWASGAEKWSVEGCFAVVGKVGSQVYLWSKENGMLVVGLESGEIEKKVEPGKYHSDIQAPVIFNPTEGTILCHNGQTVFAIQ